MTYKKFEYTVDKENYTDIEVKKLIEMFGKYQDKFIQEYDGVIAEVTPYRAEAKKKKLSALMPKEANLELIEDIILLSKLNDDMDDEAIKTAIETTVKNKSFLQVSKIDDTEVKKKELFKPEVKVEKQLTKEEEKAQLRVKNL